MKILTTVERKYIYKITPRIQNDANAGEYDKEENVYKLFT